MTNRDEVQPDRPVGEFVRDGRTVMMVTTATGSQFSARPVTCVEASDGRLSFLVSTETDWVQHIEAGRSVVHVTSSDDAHGTYLALQGTASVTNDPGERERLWSPVAKAWFSGPDDPSLAILRFEVASGEYWDGPSTGIGKAVGLLRAVVSGNDASLGESGRVAPHESARAAS